MSDDFQPFPGKLAEAYRFDLTRIYKSDKAFEAELSRIRRLAKKLGALRGKLCTSAERLLEGLKLICEVNRRQMNVSVYGSLRFAVNGKDVGPVLKLQELAGVIGEGTSFFGPEIVAAGRERLDGFLDEEPGLSTFSFNLEIFLRDGDHTLSAGAEKVLATLKPHLTSW